MLFYCQLTFFLTFLGVLTLQLDCSQVLYLPFEASIMVDWSTFLFRTLRTRINIALAATVHVVSITYSPPIWLFLASNIMSPPSSWRCWQRVLLREAFSAHDRWLRCSACACLSTFPLLAFSSAWCQTAVWFRWIYHPCLKITFPDDPLYLLCKCSNDPVCFSYYVDLNFSVCTQSISDRFKILQLGAMQCRLVGHLPANNSTVLCARMVCEKCLGLFFRTLLVKRCAVVSWQVGFSAFLSGPISLLASSELRWTLWKRRP